MKKVFLIETGPRSTRPMSQCRTGRRHRRSINTRVADPKGRQCTLNRSGRNDKSDLKVVAFSYQKEAGTDQTIHPGLCFSGK